MLFHSEMKFAFSLSNIHTVTITIDGINTVGGSVDWGGGFGLIVHQVTQTMTGPGDKLNLEVPSR